MKITYDPYTDALSIAFKEGKVKKTIEIAPEVNLDIDAKSRPLYLEILGVREKIGKANAEEVTMKNIFMGKNTILTTT